MGCCQSNPTTTEDLEKSVQQEKPTKREKRKRDKKEKQEKKEEEAKKPKKWTRAEQLAWDMSRI
jgi:hypothetical protein